MRAIQVALIGLVLLAPGLARAADRCVWTDPGKKPRLYLDDRVVVFRDYYSPEWAACQIGQGNKDFEVQWIVGSDPQAAPVETEKVHLYGGNEDGPRKTEVKLFPNHICDDKGARRPQSKLAPMGTPGREYQGAVVPVRVRIVATGALQPLNFTSPAVDVLCRACSASGGGSLQVNQDSNERDLVLEGEADRGWFECASQGATLALLGFGGQSTKEVTVAIRPDLTIGGLEKEFTRKGDKVVLRKPLPLSRLCAHGAKVWSFETWGRGELMHLGGGGRSVHELRCK
jgi:hypothetical protein